MCWAPKTWTLWIQCDYSLCRTCFRCVAAISARFEYQEWDKCGMHKLAVTKWQLCTCNEDKTRETGKSEWNNGFFPLFLAFYEFCFFFNASNLSNYCFVLGSCSVFCVAIQLSRIIKTRVMFRSISMAWTVCVVISGCESHWQFTNPIPGCHPLCFIAYSVAVLSMFWWFCVCTHYHLNV